MPATALRWGSEALWQQLEPLLPGLSVEIVATTSSTNTALLDRARVVHDTQVNDGNVMLRRSVESGAFGRRAADVQPCLLVAEHQTAGRGRQGRDWESSAGASLTFSLGLPLAVSDWSGLSLAVGVALADALAPGSQSSAGPKVGADDLAAAAEPLPRIGLKWPNDLWLMDAPQVGRKLGGVLIETVAAGARRFVVIGVGLNVLPFRVNGLTTGFACAQELDAGTSPPALLAQVAPPLVRALKLFEANGFAAFAARFAALDVLRGQRVRTVRGDPAEGIARGVNEHGALLLATADGLKTVTSGEVSVRLDGEPGAPC